MSSSKKGKDCQIIRTRKRKNPYAVIDKAFLSNVKLSWKAKGLLSYLLSKPDNWKIYVKDLINQSTDGRDAVYAGLKELEVQGYLERKKIRDDKGKILGYEYIIYERPANTGYENPYPENPDMGHPYPDFPYPEKPYPEKPYPENPYPENPTLLNNDLTNNELTNNDLTNNKYNKYTYIHTYIQQETKTDQGTGDPPGHEPENLNLSVVCKDEEVEQVIKHAKSYGYEFPFWFAKLLLLEGGGDPVKINKAVTSAIKYLKKPVKVDSLEGLFINAVRKSFGTGGVKPLKHKDLEEKYA
ncbi:MAG: hypothetical protein HPY58_14110, partial [Firmicutes bacterium]|nr:hypothetical protein [Bacillota bacterium]